jgi:ParB/RepB/Spo0J family partition protein
MSAAIATELRMMAIKDITPAKDNPRREVGDVSELAASIKSAGILEPLVVTVEPKATFQPRNGGGPVTMHEERHLLVIGHRRLAAAKLAGLTEVPVIVRTLSENERIEAMVIENLQRTDLAPLEEAQAFKRLLDLGCSQHKLAERLGRSQSHISKRLALLELPDVAIKALDSGGISLPDAYELTRLVEAGDHGKSVDHVKHAMEERKRNGYFRDMKQVVDQELEVRERQRKADATRARLQSEGVKLLKDVDYPYYSPPAGTIRLGKDFGNLDIPVHEHAKLPCHRAAVVKNTGSATYLCNDPQSHLKGKDGKKLANNLPTNAVVDRKKEQVEKAKREADNQVLAEAAAARKKLLARALKSRVPKTAAAHILIQILLDVANKDYEVAETTAELLGIKQAKMTDSQRGLEAAIVKFATKSTDNLWRAALAVSFAIPEFQLDEGYGQKAVLDRHMAYLKKLGYLATPAENRFIRGAV